MAKTVRIKMLTSVADDRVETIQNEETGHWETFLELDEWTANRYIESGQAEPAGPVAKKDDLTKLAIPALKELAAKLGLTFGKKAKKGELLTAIAAAEAAAEAAPDEADLTVSDEKVDGEPDGEGDPDGETDEEAAGAETEPGELSAPPEDETPAEDLSKLKVSELRALAAERGLELPKSASRPQLLEALAA